jgi:hypothetical protein
MRVLFPARSIRNTPDSLVPPHPASAGMNTMARPSSLQPSAVEFGGGSSRVYSPVTEAGLPSATATRNANGTSHSALHRTRIVRPSGDAAAHCHDPIRWSRVPGHIGRRTASRRDSPARRTQNRPAESVLARRVQSVSRPCVVRPAGLQRFGGLTVLWTVFVADVVSGRLVVSTGASVAPPHPPSPVTTAIWHEELRGGGPTSKAHAPARRRGSVMSHHASPGSCPC